MTEETRKLVLTPASSYLNEPGETLEVASTPCSPRSSADALQPVVCGHGVVRCATCRKTIAPSRLRQGLGCPRHLDGDQLADSCENPVRELGLPCRLHGGSKPPQVRAAVARRAVEQEASRVLERLDRPEPITDPVSELMTFAAEARAYHILLREKVSELETLQTTDVFNAEKLRAVVESFERSLARMSKLLLDINKLNLSERRVELEERQAAAIHSVILSALAKAAVPDPGRQRFVEALSTELKALEVGSPLRPNR